VRGWLLEGEGDCGAAAGCVPCWEDFPRLVTEEREASVIELDRCSRSFSFGFALTAFVAAGCGGGGGLNAVCSACVACTVVCICVFMDMPKGSYKRSTSTVIINHLSERVVKGPSIIYPPFSLPACLLLTVCGLSKLGGQKRSLRGRETRRCTISCLASREDLQVAASGRWLGGCILV